MKRLVIDIDDTISRAEGGDYANAELVAPVRAQLAKYKAEGFTIALYTSRNMRTYEGNTGLILANTVPVLIAWLDHNNVPYDEIHIGKPWCGFEGFYVDDKAVRPDEFASLSLEQIQELLTISKVRMRALEQDALSTGKVDP